jgi:hypothetical protein
VRNYRAEKSHFLPDDFTDMESLQDIFEEISNGEADLTPAGKAFLEQYYGLTALAQDLHAQGWWINKPNMTTQEIEAWLKDIVPMEISNFISDARGYPPEGKGLPDSFLPPK